MKASVGYSNIPDSKSAGQAAAEQAILTSGRDCPCDMVFLFSTANHDSLILRQAVTAVVGQSVPIYGGGAVGIITNNDFGYAGDQVGVACLWLEGARYHALTESGLAGHEAEIGRRLGKQLEKLKISREDPVLLFYDAIKCCVDGQVQLNMGSWLLDGMKEMLGFLPLLTGAGLQGDFANHLTNQYIGSHIGSQCATALVFPDDIRIDSTLLHGCRPASEYYTVTKADGSVILEINHRPAIPFVDELFHSVIKPEDYPFFLLFGINMGKHWGTYNDQQYASQLCLGVDRERNGIIMFEADMKEGTEFQIMYHSLDLDYMKPLLLNAFLNLRGRKPVFALYINCAGRCAGYNGTESEDALVLQQIVGSQVPVLGIYTGVEIAPVAGESRVLDWNGVFCLFSQEAPETGTNQKTVPQFHPIQSMQAQNIGQLCEYNIAHMYALKKQSIRLRYELEIKRRGFSLISDMASLLREENDYHSIFTETAKRLNSTLNMQKTLVLMSDERGRFTPTILHGFSDTEREQLRERKVVVPEELLGNTPVMVTGADMPERFKELRELFALPFFIAASIFVKTKASILILTGRTVEQQPFLTRLGNDDRDNVQAIVHLLESAVTRLYLHDAIHQADTDSLTGLWNRRAFTRLTEEELRDKRKTGGAFMMIDADFFKSINDTYGHLTGDNVLKGGAKAMRKVLHSTDIIGRYGGDEFTVFCRGICTAEMAGKKAVQIAEAWKTVIPDGGTKHLTASIGIALAPAHGTRFQELYIKADTALYQAKANGRNGYLVFTDELLSSFKGEVANVKPKKAI